MRFRGANTIYAKAKHHPFRWCFALDSYDNHWLCQWLSYESGRLYMVIPYKDINGKTKRKWVKTGLPERGNKKKAQAMLEKWLHEHQDCDITRGDLLLADYMEAWLERVKSALQPSTVRGYNDKLKNHIIPYFSHKKIKLIDLKVRDLEEFYFQHLNVEKTSRLVVSFIAIELFPRR